MGKEPGSVAREAGPRRSPRTAGGRSRSLSPLPGSAAGTPPARQGGPARSCGSLGGERWERGCCGRPRRAGGREARADVTWAAGGGGAAALRARPAAGVRGSDGCGDEPTLVSAGPSAAEWDKPPSPHPQAGGAEEGELRRPVTAVVTITSSLQLRPLALRGRLRHVRTPLHMRDIRVTLSTATTAKRLHAPVVTRHYYACAPVAPQ